MKWSYLIKLLYLELPWQAAERCYFFPVFSPFKLFFFFFFLSAPLLCVYLALELASLVFAEMSTTVFLIFASLDFRPYMYHPLINPQSGKESFCVLCLHDTWRPGSH